MNLPTLRQLNYFVALTQTRHFGRAAEACFISQSAFSNAISELESLLNVPLVERTNRSVTITSTGFEIAAQAKLCLGDAETLVAMARGGREPLSGELHLGVIPTIAPFLLPRVLPRLGRKYPQLQLYLHEDQTQRLHAKLMDGELDLLLLALPFELSGVAVKPLYRDRFTLAYCKGTARVDPGHYRFSQLDVDSILLLEDGHCLRDHALTACKIRNTQKVRRFAASSVLTLIEMIDADLGITFLPEMAAGSAIIRSTRVKLQPLTDSSYRTIGLAWRKGSQRTEEFELFGKFLTDHH